VFTADYFTNNHSLLRRPKQFTHTEKKTECIGIFLSIKIIVILRVAYVDIIFTTNTLSVYFNILYLF
jgi:hypothetical protein